MINLLRRVRQQYLAEGNFKLYIAYAFGEIILVMAGIILALQLDSVHQKGVQKQVQIDNIENFYLSFNENLQIEPMILMFEHALEGEKLWIDYLEGNIPYHDTLLSYAYFIGATSFISPNFGFYESLKQKGLEIVENAELRTLLTRLYEQQLPEVQRAMNHFNESFSVERIQYFKKYFELEEELNILFGQNHLYFDYAMFRAKRMKHADELKSDSDFKDFLLASRLFHEGSLIHLERTLNHIEDTQTRIFYELNFLKYGTPKRSRITLFLDGYTDAEQVLVSGEFNNWRPDGSMLRTPTGWERSFDLFPGDYEYKFIINGTDWILDPTNPDTIWVPEVGSVNSVLTIDE